jgi:23S rRNA (adenine-N6)-dimethyltransferase
VGRAPRRWGWHQLAPHHAHRLVADAELPPGALVLDIGAGRGAVTEVLLDAGHRVIAVEAHPGRAAHLRRRFGAGITVVQVDARHLRLPRRPFHVVASPPYAITTPLLQLLLQRGSRLRSAHLVLQHQAARRWAAGQAPGAGRWTREFQVAVGRTVPRHAFRPPPPVSSAVLLIRRRT